jgi:hypothetical protein
MPCSLKISRRVFRDILKRVLPNIDQNLSFDASISWAMGPYRRRFSAPCCGREC